METKKSILIVDDEEGIRNLLCSVLSLGGYNVSTVSDGLAGLEELKAGDYDVVISDMKMPKASGLDILAEVKKTGRKTKVILISGYNTEEEANIIKEAGAFSFLSKPFTLDEVNETVRKALF